MNQRRGRAQAKKRAVRGRKIPRSVGSNGTVVRLRRVYDAGNVVKPVTDNGSQFGTVPSNLSDWSSLQALFGRYRLLRVTNTFMLAGEFDTTPAYPTIWCYHDFMSLGVPTSLSQAFLKTGVRPLSFNATVSKRTFSYVPMVWTSSNFSTQVPSPQMAYQTAGAFAPTFSSAASWNQNYNTSTGAATIMLLQEMLLEMSEPN